MQVGRPNRFLNFLLVRNFGHEFVISSSEDRLHLSQQFLLGNIIKNSRVEKEFTNRLLKKLCTVLVTNQDFIFSF